MAEEKPDLALTETQNWGSRTHRELYESVHVDNDPGQTGTLAQDWTGLAGEIGEHARQMDERIGATESAWQGKAANAARSAVRQLAGWADTAAKAANDLGTRVSDQARIMEDARAAMPEPVEFDWQSMLTQGFATGGLAGFAVAAADVRAKSDQANAAHEQAVAVMTKMETDSRAVDSATPKFTPPPNPLNTSKTALRRVEAQQAPGAEASPMMQGTEGSATGQGQGQAADGSVPGVPGETPEGGAPGIPGAGAGAPGAGQDGTAAQGAPNLQVPGGVGGGAAGGGADAFRSGTSVPGVSSPAAASAPGMPDLSQYQPAAAKLSSGSDTTKSQSAVNAPSLNVPNSGTGGMPDLESYRPGGTTAQSAPGASAPNFSMPPGNRRTSGEDTVRRNTTPSVPAIPDTTGGRTGGNPRLNPTTSYQPPTPRTTGPAIPGTGGTGSTGRPVMPGLSTGSGGSGGAGGFGSGGSGTGGSGTAGESLARGAATGSGAGTGARGGVPAEGSVAGRGGASGAGAMGAGGMGGMGGARGQGEEDKERKSNPYVQGEQIFDSPGDDLPPPVIGAGKKKAVKKPDEGS